MKIITLIIFIVLIGGIVFYTFTSASQELNQQYNNSYPINTTLWEGKYNYTDQVNSSISPLITDFNNIQDEEKGWFTRITSGIIAVPHAVIAFASLAIVSVTTMSNIITTGGTHLKIGLPIIIALITMLVVWVVGKLLEYFNRSST